METEKKTYTVGGVIIRKAIGVPDYQAMIDTGLTTEQVERLITKWSVYDRMIEGGSRHGVGYALRLAKIEGDYEMAVDIAKAKRRGWLVWLTVTQRQWQSRCRSEARARHHDSVSIREKYVRANV